MADPRSPDTEDGSTAEDDRRQTSFPAPPLPLILSARPALRAGARRWALIAAGIAMAAILGGLVAALATDRSASLPDAAPAATDGKPP